MDNIGYEEREKKKSQRGRMKAEPIVLGRSSHVISRRHIDSDALKVLYRLHRSGYKAYLVGGAVRDLLLGRVPKDFDVATNARPGEIKKLFRNSYLIGRRFRLAHIRFRGGKTIEVATFRREPEETSGTDIHNTFGTPAEDAIRRDITINALFYDISTFAIIDYIGGLRDIEEGIIRVIGDPYQRFREDPIRILRVLRHASRLNFSIDDATAQAIYPTRELLGICSGARMFEELNKDIVSGFLMPVFSFMDLYGVLSHVLGGVGKFYMLHPGHMAKLLDKLSYVDEFVRSGKTMPQEIVFSILFWPWAHEILTNTERGVDKTKILHGGFVHADVQVTIPKVLKSNVIQILLIVEAMFEAMQTGRFRWLLKKRTYYRYATFIFSIIQHGYLMQENDPFDTTFTRAYGSPRRSRKRRHSRPKRQGALA